MSAAKPEKMINYEVQPLDLAPFKALRWQRRRWVDASQADGASQQAAQLTVRAYRGRCGCCAAACCMFCPR